MNSAERQRQQPKRRNKADTRDVNDVAAPQDSLAPVAPTTRPAVRTTQPVASQGYRTPVTRAESQQHAPVPGPNLWALPDANLGWWIVPEDGTSHTHDTLPDRVPSIYIPELSVEGKNAVAERCRASLSSQLKQRWQEDLFELIKRLMLGGTFMIGGVIALRFIEFFDIPIMLGALGYTAYAAIRYGLRLAGSLEAAHRPYSNFMGEPFVVSPLMDRLSAALEFRRAQPDEKRGESPDAELLDANAYRKLIRENVVTRDELCALGRAVQARLKQSAGATKSLSQVSHAEGIDAESAALYSDLAQAAAEIEFDSEFK